MSNNFCPKCGAALKEGAKFCHVCGFQIVENQDNVNVQTEPSTQQQNEKINMHTFTDVKMDEVMTGIKSGNIFKRAFGIMFKPKQEWETVARETPKIPMLIFAYTLIFCVIPLVSIILGYGLIGVRHSFGFGVIWSTNLGFGISYAFTFIVASFSAVIVSAVIITALAPAFKAEKNFGRALQLTTYSFTPMFFASALYILPFLSFLVYLVGLYGSILLLFGLPIILKVPKNTQIGYYFTSLGIMYGIFFIVLWMFRAIFWAIFVGSLFR